MTDLQKQWIELCELLQKIGESAHLLSGMIAAKAALVPPEEGERSADADWVDEDEDWDDDEDEDEEEDEEGEEEARLVLPSWVTSKVLRAARRWRGRELRDGLDPVEGPHTLQQKRMTKKRTTCGPCTRVDHDHRVIEVGGFVTYDRYGVRQKPMPLCPFHTKALLFLELYIWNQPKPNFFSKVSPRNRLSR